MSKEYLLIRFFLIIMFDLLSLMKQVPSATYLQFLYLISNPCLFRILTLVNVQKQFLFMMVPVIMKLF